MPRQTHERYINQKPIYQVPVNEIVTLQNTVAVTMAHDVRISINTALPNNPLLQPGLRLGTWPEESQP